jgi:hypothetical protein
MAQPLSLDVSQPTKMKNRIQTDPHEKQDGVAKLRVKVGDKNTPKPQEFTES